MSKAEGFQVIRAIADGLVERQGLLANNLANIDTKDYVRQDVDFGRLLSEVKSGIEDIEGGNGAKVARATYDDQNKVSLEKEMSSLYNNHLRYTLIVKAIGHHFEHMKKALEVRAS